MTVAVEKENRTRFCRECGRPLNVYSGMCDGHGENATYTFENKIRAFRKDIVTVKRAIPEIEVSSDSRVVLAELSPDVSMIVSKGEIHKARLRIMSSFCFELLLLFTDNIINSNTIYNWMLSSSDAMKLNKVIIAIVMTTLVVGCSMTSVASPLSAIGNGGYCTEGAALILTSEDCDECTRIIAEKINDVTISIDEKNINAETGIIVIDQSWVEKRGIDKTNNLLSNNIASGKILVTTSLELFENEKTPLAMTAFLENADIYSVYYDIYNDRYTCCSIDAGSFEKSAEMLKKWTHEVKSIKTLDANITKVNSGLSQWGTEYHCESYKYYDGYGWMNINTSYFPLNEDNVGYNYYYTKYDVQCMPDNNRYTSEINIHSKLSEDKKILDYAPTTTSNSSTIGINLGVSSDGVVSAGVSWAYNVSDVTVIDHSNYGTNEFSINHNIVKKTPASSSTYTVKPGKVVRVDCGSFFKTGDYFDVDEYEVVFAKEVKTGLLGLQTKWEYKKFSESIAITCSSNPHTLTLMPNGADGMTGPDYDGYIDPFEYTVSDGGQITLKEDLTKTGYNFVGFSSDKNATTVQYLAGDVVIVRNDLTLYYIWVKA